jgi:hypothetical protein
MPVIEGTALRRCIGDQQMRNRLLCAIVLAGSVTLATAQDSGLGQSIMFETPPQDHSDLTTLPPGQKKKDLNERCADMSAEIQRLKGKPQRRSTMADRYRQECVRP